MVESGSGGEEKKEADIPKPPEPKRNNTSSRGRRYGVFV